MASDTRVWQKLHKCARIYSLNFQHYRAYVSKIHETNKYQRSRQRNSSYQLRGYKRNEDLPSPLVRYVDSAVLQGSSKPTTGYTSDIRKWETTKQAWLRIVRFIFCTLLDKVPPHSIFPKSRNAAAVEDIYLGVGPLEIVHAH